MSTDTMIMTGLCILCFLAGAAVLGSGVWLGMAISRGIWSIARDNDFTTRTDHSAVDDQNRTI